LAAVHATWQIVGAYQPDLSNALINNFDGRARDGAITTNVK
jgi:hypothetical protein